ncbi:hypothetical protein P8C59_009259 [Phyllachora maydis]|uniref:Zinc finger PHD-type domain-containing protein n=1 Tax=Phyllachora maydis TaxID=1825666 RepID=A0AAD9MFF3_9PEZI|nr:hypothetical protein P8C59_009259 [Phyllachora maydis]
MRAPRRARGGGGKKGSRGGGAGREKKSSGGGFGPNASSTTAGADADVPMDNESNDGEDAGPYCICRGPDNHEFMIGCDRCSDWFHGRCVGMDKYIGENLVQRYMCSLEGCSAPARLYPEVRDDEDEEPAVAPESGAGRQEPSVFCCDEHCQHWWELLIAKLPKGRSVGGEMTQEVFVGLLHASPPAPNGQIGGWRLGQEPFGVTPDFWDNFQPHEVLTAEERAFLDSSAAERRGLGEEMMLCEKMVQLLEMALERRESAIAAVITDSGSAKGAQDICGYDARLDTTGTVTQFAAFVSSPAGEAVFKAGRLDATATPVATNDSPTMVSEELDSIAAAAARATETATAGMCMKKKCKPHAGWNVELTKTVKRQLRELAAQAKQKLDAETRVRDSAASRYQRRLKEHNWVQVMEDPLENQLTGYVAMERKRAGR